MPGICPSSRDWLCSENVSDSNSVGTSSIASEVINEEINRESELPPSSARSSRISTRSNRPSTSAFDSYLTTDGGFKRRSRRDVSNIEKKTNF
jgi:hypothetical protein